MENIQHFLNSFWQSVTYLELIGFATALLYSVLASYESVWCWPFALISSVIIAYINIHDHYTFQALLQVFYFVMAAYGWYAWMYDKRDQAPLKVISYPSKKIAQLVLLGVPLTIIGALINMHFHTDKPWLDSALTMYSIIATWMMTRKIIQNWIFWIIIDPLNILLYADDTRRRYLIALLFVIYTIVAIFGYFKWRQQLKAQAALA